MRALYVTTPDCPAAWLTELLAVDRAMTITIEPASGSQLALGRLREETFDAVIVRHAPPELDAVEFVEAHRLTAADDPLLVLGSGPENLLAPLCYEVGADAYLACATLTARQLIWALGHAIEWHALVRENRRLIELDRKRARLEHNEAQRLLEQQRGLLGELQELACGQETAIDRLATAATAVRDGPLEVPTELVVRYRDLLRAHVIMGAGNLAAETAGLADSLAAIQLSAPRLVQLHVHVLEETLRGLGGRSSRHIMARADLLVLDVMAQLAERYRTRGVGSG